LPKPIWAKRSEAFYPLLYDPKGKVAKQPQSAQARLNSLLISIPLFLTPLIRLSEVRSIILFLAVALDEFKTLLFSQ